MNDMTTARPSVFKDESLNMDNRALRAYSAALDAYNAGNWDAAIIACGKALEEVAKAELPYNERNGALGQLLEKLPKHLKMDQPMIEFAAAVKDAKGLGAHFDLEKETNEEIARATLSLLESFVNYIYIFKAKVAHLKELVDERAQQVARERSKPVVEQGHAVGQAAGQAVVVRPASATPFDAFEAKADPYDIKSSNWNLGNRDE